MGQSTFRGRIDALVLASFEGLSLCGFVGAQQHVVLPSTEAAANTAVVRVDSLQTFVAETKRSGLNSAGYGIGKTAAPSRRMGVLVIFDRAE